MTEVQNMKAVLLDVSGVLRNNQTAMWNSFQRVLAPAGFDFSKTFSDFQTESEKALAAYRLRGFSQYNLVENCIEALWALQQEGISLKKALKEPRLIDAAVSVHPFVKKTQWAHNVKADFRQMDPAYLDSVPCVPYAREALQCLSARFLLGVVSNSGSAFNKAWLNRHGFSRFFRVFIAEQDVLRKKPAPEGILLVCRRLFFPPRTCYYVGDAQSDMQAAKNAGSVPVGVLSGTATKAQLKAAGAWRCFDDLWQMSKFLVDRPPSALRRVRK